MTKKFWRRRDFWGRSGSVYESKSEIIIPEIKYLTNDSWEEISCLTSGIGYPILHSADYANSRLYILTIPDNYGDLYNLPAEILTQIREVLARDMYVRLDGPSQVAMFVYDNDTFIVESFLPDSVDVKIVTDKRIGRGDIDPAEVVRAGGRCGRQNGFQRENQATFFSCLQMRGVS
jgi:hypothetical protein